MAAPKSMSVFRRGHVLNLLNSFSFEKQTPLDGHLRTYFYKHKAVGAHERREVADTVYEMIRHKLYLETISRRKSWEDMLRLYLDPDFSSNQRTSGHPAHIRFSFPLEMVEILRNIYGSKTEALLAALNHRAPLTVRVNTLKTSPTDLMQKWRLTDQIGVRRCSHSLYGLQILSRNSLNLFGMEDFKKGMFEVQDEASQLCASLIEAKPGMSVLDFCAGAGGKSLALAPKMSNKGQIYLHDLRLPALEQAKKRLKRAGVHNAQIVSDLKRLKGNMDIVLVDVPCSGTGTIRRNPDIKWKFSIEKLNQLVNKQLEIVKEAVIYMKPKGELVYTTCSLLPQENAELVQLLREQAGLEPVSDFFQTSPMTSDMDGFFTARLRNT